MGPVVKAVGLRHNPDSNDRNRATKRKMTISLGRSITADPGSYCTRRKRTLGSFAVFKFPDVGKTVRALGNLFFFE